MSGAQIAYDYGCFSQMKNEPGDGMSCRREYVMRGVRNAEAAMPLYKPAANGRFGVSASHCGA